eukprot:TRINITY_DN24606_c0_g1_i1.p1 TRINITY_DN24606_c0_g1~~TRINITY_DN24606_c0_g1_i1.p1  ORF type:complete len:210 (+),score=19.41 TRINITY_DN24606_c0_g1_i1:80-709(+)
MAPAHGGRIVIDPDAPLHVLEVCRASPQNSPRVFKGSAWESSRSVSRGPKATGNGRRSGQRSPSELPYSGKSNTSCATLFGGERVGGGTCKRSSAVIFRRPSSSRAPPHQRPIFICGENGTDTRMCVDVHAPRRFSSNERAFAERAIHQHSLLKTGSMQLPNSRPASVAGYSTCYGRAVGFGTPSSSSSRPGSALDFAAMPAFRPISVA